MVVWLRDGSSSFPFLSLITVCLISVPFLSFGTFWFGDDYGLLLGEILPAPLPPFCLDTSTNLSTVLKFAVSLSRFRSFQHFLHTLVF